MGRFLNPDNSAFQVALNSKIYIDKTGLIEYTNSVLNTKQALICNSRPRRFGKSTTIDMLVAYYSKGCHSEKMFTGKIISQNKHFKKHLNRYNVIRIDVQWCLTSAKNAAYVVDYIQESVIAELREFYPNILGQSIETLAEALSIVNQMTGDKFMIIIDEWDILIRDEAANVLVQEKYINLLRSLFKGSHPTEFLHLVFLTGILPIKKFKTQSALNNFDEFTMIEPDMFAPYIGFTENEVKMLCINYHKDFEKVKCWYNGYLLSGYQVYNPKAVVSVMLRGEFRSYWSKTGTYESILSLINMDFDGLKTAIIELISGAFVEVEVENFQNDMVTFTDKDDVLTLLIHLGYLGYDSIKRTVFIPNEEIRQEFLAATKKKKWNELLNFQRKSNNLLKNLQNNL